MTDEVAVGREEAQSGASGSGALCGSVGNGVKREGTSGFHTEESCGARETRGAFDGMWSGGLARESEKELGAEEKVV